MGVTRLFSTIGGADRAGFDAVLAFFGLRVPIVAAFNTGVHKTISASGQGTGSRAGIRVIGITVVAFIFTIDHTIAVQICGAAVRGSPLMLSGTLA